MRRPTLTDIATGAILIITAWSEWHLGVAVLSLPLVLAAAVPVAVDVYVIAAMRAQRDRAWAISLAIVSLAMATTTELVDIDQAVKVVAAGVYSAVLILVLWRVHELRAGTDTLQSRVATLEDELAGELKLHAAEVERWRADEAGLTSQVEQLGGELRTVRDEIAERAGHLRVVIEERDQLQRQVAALQVQLETADIVDQPEGSADRPAPGGLQELDVPHIGTAKRAYELARWNGPVDDDGEPRPVTRDALQLAWRALTNGPAPNNGRASRLLTYVKSGQGVS